LTIPTYNTNSILDFRIQVSKGTKVYEAEEKQFSYRCNLQHTDLKTWSPRLGVGAVGQLPTHHKNIQMLKDLKIMSLG
jgi:hypothetical protein